jgi:type 1 glutamine amidotransferase
MALIDDKKDIMKQRSAARPFALLVTFAVLGSVVWTTVAQNQGPDRSKRVLVFSGTGWFRHPEIPRMNGWLASVLKDEGFAVDVSETPKDLTPARLAQYQVLVFNNANALTDLLDEKQRQAVADWYKKGRGLVALHAALVHQTKWQWFNDLAGCDFNSDSDFLQAKVVIDPTNKDHPSVRGFGPEFTYSADWTNHDRPVTGLPGVKVLFRVDETTFEPVRAYFKTNGGKAMGKDHPAAWLREHDGGRFFYTELGHDLRSLDTKFGRKHVSEGVRWAAGN